MSGFEHKVDGTIHCLEAIHTKGWSIYISIVRVPCLTANNMTIYDLSVIVAFYQKHDCYCAGCPVFIWCGVKGLYCHDHEDCSRHGVDNKSLNLSFFLVIVLVIIKKKKRQLKRCIPTRRQR